MRILSIHQGFATDHSTVAYRYTAPDKATAWRAFWEGLPAVCAAGQVPVCLPAQQLLSRPAGHSRGASAASAMRFWMRSTRKVSQGEGCFLSANDQPFQATYIEPAV